MKHVTELHRRHALTSFACHSCLLLIKKTEMFRKWWDQSVLCYEPHLTWRRASNFTFQRFSLCFNARSSLLRSPFVCSLTLSLRAPCTAKMSSMGGWLESAREEMGGNDKLGYLVMLRLRSIACCTILKHRIKQRESERDGDVMLTAWRDVAINSKQRWRKKTKMRK